MSTTWSQFFASFNDPTVDSVYMGAFGHEAARDAAEPNAVRDSVLVLIDGVRRYRCRAENEETENYVHAIPLYSPPKWSYGQTARTGGEAVCFGLVSASDASTHLPISHVLSSRAGDG
jgi:hypothetical protein